MRVRPRYNQWLRQDTHSIAIVDMGWWRGPGRGCEPSWLGRAVMRHGLLGVCLFPGIWWRDSRGSIVCPYWWCCALRSDAMVSVISRLGSRTAEACNSGKAPWAGQHCLSSSTATAHAGQHEA